MPRFKVLTLFPEIFGPFINSSVIGRAVESGALEIECVQIRDFTENKYGKVDDSPFGGGAGMVMTVQPLKSALQESASENAHVIMMSPRGRLLDQKRVRELSQMEEIVLVCGRYEGVDQRFIDRYVDEEISIGDYVLTGGEIAAMAVIDSVGRLGENVLGNPGSLESESHSGFLLEYPQYTKPEIYDGDQVPGILKSGHHKNIDAWRHEQSVEITKKRRPDLYKKYLNKEEQ